MSRNITGERIAELLRERDMTQRELAKRTGVTEVSMSRYINGERIPKAMYLSNIAKVLGTTQDYLLGNESKEEAVESAEDSFLQVHRLIARNTTQWSEKQKAELAKTLFS